MRSCTGCIYYAVDGLGSEPYEAEQIGGHRYHTTQAARDAIEQRRTNVARLLAAGRSYSEIVTELGIPRTTAHRDAVWLRNQWRRLSVASYETKAESVLTRYSRIADEAYAAYLRSIREAKKTRVKSASDGTSEETVETTDEIGDPRFLDLARKATENIANVIGAQKPIKHALTDKDGNDIPFSILRFVDMPERKHLPEGANAGDG